MDNMGCWWVVEVAEVVVELVVEVVVVEVMVEVDKRGAQPLIHHS